jgi:hypothetical protein
MLGNGRFPNYIADLYKQKTTFTEYETDVSRKYGMMDRKINHHGLDEMHEEQKRVLADNSIGQSILYEHEQPSEYRNSRQVLNLMYEGARQGDTSAVNLPDGTFYDFHSLIPEERNSNFEAPVHKYKQYFEQRTRNLPKFSDASVAISDTPASDSRVREQRLAITEFLRNRLQNFDTSLTNLHRKDITFKNKLSPRENVKDTQDTYSETELIGNRRSKHQKLEDYVLRGQLSVTDHRVPEGYYNLTRGLRKPDTAQVGATMRHSKYDMDFAHPSIEIRPQKNLPFKMIDEMKKHNDTQLSMDSINRVLFKESSVADTGRRKRKHDSAKQLALDREARIVNTTQLRDLQTARPRGDHGFAPQHEDIRASVTVFEPRMVRDLCDKIRRSKKNSDDTSITNLVEHCVENWAKLSHEQKMARHSNAVYKNMTNTAWMEEQDSRSARGELLSINNAAGRAGLKYDASVAPNHPHLSHADFNPNHDVRDDIRMKHRPVNYDPRGAFAHNVYKYETVDGHRGRDLARPARGYKCTGSNLRALNSSEFNDTLGTIREL